MTLKTVNILATIILAVCAPVMVWAVSTETVVVFYIGIVPTCATLPVLLNMLLHKFFPIPS